jgi:hypothetical protein
LRGLGAESWPTGGPKSSGRHIGHLGFVDNGIIRQNPYLYLLRPDPVSKRGQAKPLPESRDKTRTAPDKAIVCRQCLHVITSDAERLVINGAHLHTFANPQGIVFEIACYRNAAGCRYIGQASSEFTWFSGYVWRIAVCANCHTHLGWRFSAADGHFFHGLITSRLIVPSR